MLSNCSESFLSACLSLCQVEGYLSLENVCLVKSSEVCQQFSVKLIFMDVHVWNHNEVDETTMPLILFMFQSVAFLKVRVKFMVLIEL